MGVSVTGQEGQVASPALHRDLKRVIVRIARVLQPGCGCKGYDGTTRGVGIALADRLIVDQTGKRAVVILAAHRVDVPFATRSAVCTCGSQRKAECRISIKYVHAALNVMSLGSNVSHCQDG